MPLNSPYVQYLCYDTLLDSNAHFNSKCPDHSCTHILYILYLLQYLCNNSLTNPTFFLHPSPEAFLESAIPALIPLIFVHHTVPVEPARILVVLTHTPTEKPFAAIAACCTVVFSGGTVSADGTDSCMAYFCVCEGKQTNKHLVLWSSHGLRVQRFYHLQMGGGRRLEGC